MLPLRRAAMLIAVPLLVVAAGLALPGGGPAPVLAAGTFDAEMVQLINQDRADNGVAPLAWNASLSGIGESTPYGGCGYTIAGRAEDMVERDYFSIRSSTAGARMCSPSCSRMGSTTGARGRTSAGAAGSPIRSRLPSTRTRSI